MLEVFQPPKTVVWFASLDALGFESGRRRSFLRAGGMSAKIEGFAHERRVALILKSSPLPFPDVCARHVSHDGSGLPEILHAQVSTRKADHQVSVKNAGENALGSKNIFVDSPSCFQPCPIFAHARACIWLTLFHKFVREPGRNLCCFAATRKGDCSNSHPLSPRRVRVLSNRRINRSTKVFVGTVNVEHFKCFLPPVCRRQVLSQGSEKEFSMSELGFQPFVWYQLAHFQVSVLTPAFMSLSPHPSVVKFRLGRIARFAPCRRHRIIVSFFFFLLLYFGFFALVCG